MRHLTLRFGACIAALCVQQGVAYAQKTSVVVETAGAYNTFSNCCASTNNCPSIPGSNSIGTNFVNTLLANNLYGFTNTALWQDRDVWDRDFYDSDLKAGADDNASFDAPGAAISLFAGHGLQPNLNYDQYCDPHNNGYPCQYTTYPPGATADACVWSPSSDLAFGSGLGICRWNNAVPTIITCGDNDNFGRNAAFNSGMVFGENPYDGAWRGAATNGDASLVIIHMSFGMLLPFASEWWPLFGGAQLIAGTAVAYDDVDGNAPSFGTAAAYGYYSNSNGSIKDQYINNISMVSDGGGCPQSHGGTSYPGGFNGCGCHAIMTMGSSGSGAFSTINEAWPALQIENAATKGNNYWDWYVGCNYNPSNSWFGGP